MIDSMQLCIRSMTRADLNEVSEIEHKSFRAPWSLQSFKQDLQRKDSIALVLIGNEKIIGYIIGWHVLDEIHIGNLAVHPDYRRQGFAKKLINALMHSCEPIICTWLEVRQSNQAARKLYQHLGFEEISIRKGYYADEGEDAIVMVNRQNTASQISASG